MSDDDIRNYIAEVVIHGFWVEGQIKSETYAQLCSAVRAVKNPRDARIASLEKELAASENLNFQLSADQCEDGYAGEHGEHRCKLVDALEKELADFQRIAKYVGVCMSCIHGTVDPHGCTDCLGTGWDQGFDPIAGVTASKGALANIMEIDSLRAQLSTALSERDAHRKELARRGKCPIGLDAHREICSAGNCHGCLQDLRSQLSTALSDLASAKTGLMEIVHCTSPLTRSAIREACAEVLKQIGKPDISAENRSPLVDALSTALSDLAAKDAEITQLKATRLRLDGRIHAQRKAFRDTWEIVEQRRKWLGCHSAREWVLNMMRRERGRADKALSDLASTREKLKEAREVLTDLADVASALLPATGHIYTATGHVVPILKLTVRGSDLVALDAQISRARTIIEEGEGK